jgi:hypothetical protein
MLEKYYPLYQILLNNKFVDFNQRDVCLSSDCLVPIQVSADARQTVASLCALLLQTPMNPTLPTLVLELFNYLIKTDFISSYTHVP